MTSVPPCLNRRPASTAANQVHQSSLARDLRQNHAARNPLHRRKHQVVERPPFPGKNLPPRQRPPRHSSGHGQTQRGLSLEPTLEPKWLGLSPSTAPSEGNGFKSKDGNRCDPRVARSSQALLCKRRNARSYDSALYRLPCEIPMCPPASHPEWFRDMES